MAFLPRFLACSLALSFIVQSGCFAAKFVMTPMFGRSHYLVLARLGKELVARGHEVRDPRSDQRMRVHENSPWLQVYFKRTASFRRLTLAFVIGKIPLHQMDVYAQCYILY